MAWVKVSDDFYDHPKFLTLPPAAVGLWVTGLAWSNRNLTDGLIAFAALARLGYGRETAEHLELAGLWELGPDGWIIHDYLAFQPSADDIRNRTDRIATIRAEAGRKGAESRWQHGKPHGKAKASDSKPMAKPKQTDGPNPNPVPKKVKTLAPNPLAQEGSRPPDPLWDAVCLACGIEQADLTNRSRAATNGAVGDLRRARADPAEVPGRAGRWAKMFPGATLTPSALAKHWPQLNGTKPGNAKQRKCPASDCGLLIHPTDHICPYAHEGRECEASHA